MLPEPFYGTLDDHSSIFQFVVGMRQAEENISQPPVIPARQDELGRSRRAGRSYPLDLGSGVDMTVRFIHGGEGMHGSDQVISIEALDLLMDRLEIGDEIAALHGLDEPFDGSAEFFHVCRSDLCVPYQLKQVLSIVEGKEKARLIGGPSSRYSCVFRNSRAARNALPRWEPLFSSSVFISAQTFSAPSGRKMPLYGIFG